MKFDYIYNKLLSSGLINEDVLINEVVLEWDKIFDGKTKIKLQNNIKIYNLNDFHMNFRKEKNNTTANTITNTTTNVDEFDCVFINCFNSSSYYRNINTMTISINLYEYILFNTFIKTYNKFSQKELIEKYENIINSIAEFIAQKMTSAMMTIKKLKNNFDLFSDLLNGKFKTKKKYKDFNLIIIEQNQYSQNRYKISKTGCKNPLIQSLLITGKSDKFYNDCLKKIECKGKIDSLLLALCRYIYGYQQKSYNNFYDFFLKLFENYDDERFNNIFLVIFNGLRGIRNYLHLTPIDKNYVIKYIEKMVFDLNNNDLVEICLKLNIKTEIYKNKNDEEILDELLLNPRIIEQNIYNFISKNNMFLPSIFLKIIKFNKEKIFIDNGEFIKKIKFDNENPLIIIIKQILDGMYSPYYLKIFKKILIYNENKKFLTQELFELIKENELKYFYYILPKKMK